MKKALVRNGEIVDIAAQPYEIFCPEIAALYDTEVSDNINPGAKQTNGKWGNKAEQQQPVAPSAVVQTVSLTPPEFWMLFTPEEYYSIGHHTDKMAEQATTLLGDARLQKINLGHFFVQRFMDKLIELKIIDEARKAQIVKGEKPTDAY